MIACKYIAHMGIKIVCVSKQKILACKYITSMGKQIVSVLVQNIRAGKKNLPQGLQILRILMHLHGSEIGRQISDGLYNIV